MGSLPNLHTLEDISLEDCDLTSPSTARAFQAAKLRFTINRDVPHGLAGRIPHHHHHHHHKKLHQTRSGGYQHALDANAAWDDFIFEMAAYSPISTHGTHPNLPQRRCDSMSSSGGASSVRRLIAVVRSTPSRLGPVYSRRMLLRNFAALCLGHSTVTAAFLPLLALQSSISAWWWPRATTAVFRPNNDSGSLLLCSLFSVAALSSLVSPFLVQRIGTNWTLILGYIHASVFFGLHLYPTAYTLIPGYVMMGMWVGPITSARQTFLMTLASKLSFVATEEEEMEDNGGRWETTVQRLARGLQAAQDFGLVFGNVVSALLLVYTLPPSNGAEDSYSTSLLSSMFIHDVHGERICGSTSCPQSQSLIAIPSPSNLSSDTDGFFILPCKTSAVLASVFLGCSVMGVALTAAFLDRIRLLVYQSPLERPSGVAAMRAVKEIFKDPKLQLAAPLSIFIGLEQSFMLADFSKFYVVCALGVSNISFVFLSLGLLQSIAAFTLSMLLQHIRRFLVIVVGFLFHACLLLVLLVWKPSGDDPALFYVISAAWGVCNAIWETLNFTLLLNLYPDSWQAPLTHCYFFRCLGLAVAFGLHGEMCSFIKLYSLAGALVLAVAPYTWLEVKMDSRLRRNSNMATL